MATRFAAEHVPSPPRRRFWIGFATVFLVLAIPVAAFNLAVDPFDFRLLPHLSLIRENITRKNDTMLWTAGELRCIPVAALEKVTIAVVGDSRTDTLCRWPNSPRIFRLGGDRVINLSVGGASLAENANLLEAELPRLPKLREVLWAVPIERVGTGDLDRSGNALRLASHPLLYALSLGTLASSVEMLGAQGEGRRSGWSAADRPGIDAAHIFNPGTSGLDIAGNSARGGKNLPFSKSEKTAAANWKATMVRLDPARIQKRLREVIAPLAAKLRQRGIQIVFFFPPLHPAVSGGIEANIADLQRPYVVELERLGTVENFSLATPDGIAPVFADSMHLQQDVAHAVLADLYLRDFGPSRKNP